MKKQILDHGYLELVDCWGRDIPAGILEPGDEAIIAAARMSTSKGFLGWGPKHENCSLCMGCPSVYEHENAIACPQCRGTGFQPGDEKLLHYLYENRHSTPFEVCGMTIEVQAPIFVFREWHRHRVPFGYSELSARYTPLPDVNYIPTVERLMVNSKTNKQAGTVKDADTLEEADAKEFQNELDGMYILQEKFYQKWLKRGVPKELARIDLPVGRYSRMRATGNLRGWLGFLSLRMAPTAQYEIRVFADAVGELIAEKFSRTWELFAAGKS